MNKKIIVYSFAILTLQNSMYGALVPTVTGATAAAKSAIASKFPSIVPTGGGSKSALSIPKFELNSQQIKNLTDGLARRGGRDYLPQIQMIWETNPELMYNAQQAIQKTETEAAQQYLDQIIAKAKSIKSLKGDSFTIQDAISHNKSLDTLVNQDLASNMENLGSLISDIAYSPNFLNKIPNKHDFYTKIESPLQDLNKSIKEILTNTQNTPQQAASKLDKTLSDLKDIKNATDALRNSVTDELTSQKISSISAKLKSLETNLDNAKNILQKTSPTQQKSATFPELKNLVESFNRQPEGKVRLSESSSELQTIAPQEVLQVIPMPAEITPFFNQQTNLLKQNLASTLKNLTKLSDQIKDLGLEAKEQKTLLQAKNNIVNQLRIIIQLQKDLTSLGAHPDALTQINLKTSEIQYVISEIINSLGELHLEIDRLLPSEQRSILETFQKIINDIQAINIDAQTTALVLKEYNAQKEIMVKLKKDMDLASFTLQTQQDLATVQTTTKYLAHILSSRNILKTDKAPMSMVEVFEKQLKTYLTTFQEIKNIKDVTELSSIQTKLQAQEKELMASLDSIFSKIAWLPTSTTKNQALDTFRVLKGQFTANNRAVHKFFAKANELEEQHMFVTIKKDTIEMGYMLIIEKAKALQFSITKQFSESSITTQQSQSLKNLNLMITMMIDDIKQIEAAQTSLELDQLTTEFFKQGKLAELAKKPSSLVPVTKKPSSLVPVGSSNIISISEPSLAIPSGPTLATEVGKPYYTDSSLVVFPKIDSSLVVFPKYEQTLNETLKLFGLKLVLGLTATGAVTWLLEKATEDETVIPTSKTDIITQIKAPTNETEFKEESEKLLQEVEKLNQVPVYALGAAIKDLNFNIKLLNLQAFKEAGEIFLNSFVEKIKTLWDTALNKKNDVRARILKAWLDNQERSRQIFLELNQPEPKQERPPFKSDYEEIKRALSKWTDKQ